MPFPTLNHYLAQLSDPQRPTSSVWLDPAGQAQGKFYNCTITSAFQPIRAASGAFSDVVHTADAAEAADAADAAGAGARNGPIVAYEGLARSASAGDAGLSLWKLLDHAASDDESIELDRLCRMLHAINFFRQPEAGEADLFLNVHDRLLSAVSSNHGYAFQRILDALGLPMARIVLQLPAASAQQGWLLNYVADNYRRNGFRLALNAGTPEQALLVLRQLRPDSIKLDARHLDEAGEHVDQEVRKRADPGLRRSIDPDGALAALFAAAADSGVRLIFKRVETAQSIERLHQAGAAPVFVQGYFVDQPQAALRPALRDTAQKVGEPA